MKDWLVVGLALFGNPAFAEVSSRIEGGIDLRPSIPLSDGPVRFENEAQVGYRLAEPTQLGYVQEFQSELGEGYARLQHEKLLPWMDYTVRVYSNKLRQHFYFPARLANVLTLSLTEIPIYRWDNEAGWSNRSEWAVELSFFDEKLKAKFPLIVENVFEKVGVNPEVIYLLTEKTGVGAAYYEDVFQLVFQQAI